jgi:branched-chain amino acid aminotransferase
MSTRLPRFVHVNGRLLSGARASISVFDRGLLYGDGLFETLRAYRGKVFALDQHLLRLQSSARFLGIRVPHRAWLTDIAALLTRNRLLATDARVRITVTRGVAAPGLVPPHGIRPMTIITTDPVEPAVARAQQRGVRVALVPFARDGFLAEHKVLNYLPGVLGKVIAARHKAFEGVFVDAQGHITEGTTSNVFVWHGKRLLTPPAAGILPGLTRRMIIEAAVADGVRVTERPLSGKDLFDADEAFLTSSVIEVVPIIAVEGRNIGGATVGPRTQRLQHLYRQIVVHRLAHR